MEIWGKVSSGRNLHVLQGNFFFFFFLLLTSVGSVAAQVVLKI